ncbi:MAG: type II secretion system F family protein [Dehalococcoidia bacterium]|nr:type II secretion system F family protein [Dehalococcoidia bacterium]
MTFRYVVTTLAGEKVTGNLEAESLAAAEQALWRSGYTIIALKKAVKLPTRYELLPSVFRVKPREIVSFCRQFATLLQSGLSVTVSIDAIIRRGGSPLLVDTLRKVRQEIEAGTSFSEACAKYPRVFPLMFVRLIHVGEATGNFEPMLLRAAAYLDKQGALGARIRRALTYPAFVLASGLASVYVLLTYSLPALSSLLQEYGADLPATTRIVIAMGDIAGRYGKQIGLGIVLAVVAGYWYSTTPAGKKLRDRLFLRLPVVKKVVGGEAMSRMGYTLATLLESGLGFTESIDLLVSTTDNTALRRALSRTRTDVLSGQKFSQSLASNPVFPPLVAQMVSVGEETGRLETNLALMGEYYEKETDQAVTTLTTVIEPAAIVGVGGFVGFIAVVMMSTIYGVIKHIGS